MDKQKKSNINMIDEEYNAINRSIGEAIDKMEAKLDILHNVYNEERGILNGKIIFPVLCMIFFIFMYFRLDQLLFLVFEGLVDSEIVDLLVNINSSFILITFAYIFYRICLKRCNAKISCLESRVSDIKESIYAEKQRIESAKILETIKKNINSGIDYKINVDNALGNRIIEINTDIDKTEDSIKKYIKYLPMMIFGSVYLLLIVIMFLKNSNYVDIISILPIYMSIILVINIFFLFCDKHLTSKECNIFKIIFPIIYGIAMWIILLGRNNNYELKFEIIIPILQMIGILLSEYNSDYSMEIDKYSNGFDLAKLYGVKNIRKEKLVFRSVLIYIISELFIICMVINAQDFDSIIDCIRNSKFYLAVLLCTLGNVHLNIRGTCVGAFWGENKSLINELIKIIAIITMGIIWNDMYSVKLIKGIAYVYGLSVLIHVQRREYSI